MKISFTLPDWTIVRRLFQWLYPDLERRAAQFGKASSNKRFVHGAVDVTTTIEHREIK